MRFGAAALSLVTVVTGCAGEGGGTAGPETVTLSFRAQALEAGEEDYLCFGFPATQLAGRAVERIAWVPPSGGGVSLHHATLYAMQSPFPDGPLSCTWMPDDAVGIHIWGTGTEPLHMPEGFALSIPEGTTKMVVQAHVLRTSEAPANEASVVLGMAASPPEHLAAWHSTVTDVPAIPPHATATASSRCLARGDVHTLFAWPHMHRFGKAFHGAIERAGGGETPIVDVAAWDVTREVIHPASVDIATGDVIVTRCTWENTSPEVVEGGFDVSDEMCTQGLIWWPADAPRCKPL
ncbi:MAG: hypothetical protein QM820_26980 [Minicystis sp.]